jgi:phosphatidylserine/phosphatidylglycerophosphate/cardiolipin synthase-like enzyme
VGSQNFDWRSLDHIFEIGVRIRTPHITAGLESVFRADWDMAGGDTESLRYAPQFSIKDEVDGGDIVMAASPKKLVPAAMWDLPLLVSWIHEARGTLRIELLTYKTKSRDGSEFHDLDDALRDAAKRGVHVQLLVSTWGETDSAVQALAHEPNVEVRVLAIPPFSGGDIPFARVAHAKYAIFEGRAWVGTSNWEGDYFLQSRNVSLFFEHGGALVGKLTDVFVDAWRSPYARPPR